jgi:hypothetical protein
LCPSPACIACLLACASPELRSLKTDMPAFVEGAAAASERCESCRTTGCTAPEDPSGRSGRSSLLLRGDMVIRHDSAPNANERSVGLWKCARREQDANDVAGTRARLHDERVGFKNIQGLRSRSHRAFELSSSLPRRKRRSGLRENSDPIRWKKWTTQVATFSPWILISRGALGAFLRS